MLNIETGDRGYLMAHDKIYLQPFIEGNSKIKGIFRTLKVLVKENLIPLKKLDSLDKFTDIELKLIQT